MVLEEITKEITDAESNVENQKSSLSAPSARLDPDKRSTRQGTKSTRVTDDGSASFATTLRRSQRRSFDAIRRCSNDRSKRSRDDHSTSSPKRPTQKRSLSLPRRGFVELLEAVREQERDFEDGHSMEICNSMNDQRLIKIHDRFCEEMQSIGTLDALMHAYDENLKAALLKFLDTVIGYILYVQSPLHIGTTSAKPLDTMVCLWVVPEHGHRNQEKNILYWWLRTSVRSMKYFSIRTATETVERLLQNEGFKCPKGIQLDDHQNYMAMI